VVGAEAGGSQEVAVAEGVAGVEEGAAGALVMVEVQEGEEGVQGEEVQGEEVVVVKEVAASRGIQEEGEEEG
jgi:hypothetical protein